jgi:large subunit ribosomal protein L3
MSKKVLKPGLIGKKIAMTQIFAAGGDYYGATVVQVGPCVVTQVKSPASDGYSALQLGFGETEFRRVNRPMRGHFEKKGVKPFRHLQEIRVGDATAFKVGQQLSVAAFKEGERVDVTGISKGKGFQGVIKRHHKAGGPASHGSCFHRSTGSIGQRTYPGKVFKLMGLPGHMGDERVTVRNLKILKVDTERNLLVLNGAVPGGENAILLIRTSNPEFEKRLKSQAPAPQAAEAAPESAPEAPKAEEAPAS